MSRESEVFELRLVFRATTAEAIALVEKYGGTEQDVLAFLQTCAERMLQKAAEPLAAAAEAPYVQEVEPTYAERKVAAQSAMRQFGERAYTVGLLRREFCEAVEAVKTLALRSYDGAQHRAALAKDMTVGPA